MKQNTKITKREALRALYLHDSRDIRFIANILEDSATLIKGLYNLVILNGIEVVSSQFDMSSFNSVDTGKRYKVAELKNWILVYQDIQNDLIEVSIIETCEKINSYLLGKQTGKIAS